MIDFWLGALALTILLYVILDGFDLGVGMLFVLVPDETGRRHMLSAIAPVWDGNETWLVLNAMILVSAFPLVFATLFSAFYLPMLLMVAALIFRGVAFEFRHKSHRMRRVWDAGFVVGSFAASFIQGMAVGALVEGLPIANDHYIGGAFGWLSSFSLLCGIGLCLGYALLGAGWLTYKTAADVQALSFRLLPKLLAGVLTFLAIVFVLALRLHLEVMSRWFDRPILVLFPAIGLFACAVMAWAIARRKELVPFLCAAAIFAAALGTLAVSFYPYMIPFSIRAEDAAANHTSLAFLFWGAGVFVLPITVIYTLVVYFIFKGKIEIDGESY